MFRVLGLYGRFRRQGNLEYELRVFLKGGRPPPPLQTHPHTHTMREKRRFNGTLRILSVFQGRASQPASQGGGGGRGGGFQSLPATQPRLGAAPRLGSAESTASRNLHRPQWLATTIMVEHWHILVASLQCTICHLQIAFLALQFSVQVLFRNQPFIHQPS